MLTIERAIVDKIIAHARADHPDEACGIVAGPEGSDRPARFIPMTNAERSPTYHSFDNDEWFRVANEMFDNDEEMIVHYHSHTSTEAYPSRTDLDYLRSSLADPRVHRVIVSTQAPDEVEFRSYLLVDGEPVEEEVQIVESYG
ncbi:Mov34/MPN/PAD-1 family protein [Actinomadura livida]|uniref:M67 family metallopeptidase n=1 Tax=Actinomadura livida TaxID=79909 RepID=A0A7W7N149_9ACTN|nr:MULTISPECIES: M67 family metallopeptidase [Actinomadura]MBB4777592.1 proteasome lid subunit RPN8/RPN11 [Actinomadura catellatispora]GGU00053.1 peptidase [Actinomadura livida]